MKTQAISTSLEIFENKVNDHPKKIELWQPSICQKTDLIVCEDARFIRSVLTGLEVSLSQDHELGRLEQFDFKFLIQFNQTCYHSNGVGILYT